jgi:hypothetical protein
MLTDLASVTRTLKELFQRELATQGATIVATAAPPDRPSQNNLVSVYLFHVIESPESKNFAPLRGTGPVPVQQAPMHLILQYIVTALHDSGTDNPDGDTLTEQKFVGFIARAVHDFPVINANTTIGGVPILDDELVRQKSTIEIILRPAPKEESVAFWGTEQTKVTRLSLFVEARVFILEPKPPVLLPGIVLSVGQFIFPGTGPQLSASRNTIAFRLPPSVGSGLQTVTAAPARVALFPNVDPPTTPAPGGFDPAVLDNDRVTLEGAGLTPGRPTLFLQRADFSVKVPLAPPLAENAAWQFEVLSSSITFRVRRTVRAFLGNATGLSDVLLVPGIYTARVNLDDDRFQGHPRGSNAIAFAVTPQIASVGPAVPAATNTYTLQILADYLADPNLRIDIGIGGSALVPRLTTDPTLPDGKFEIVDGSTLRFKLPTGTTPPSAVNPLPVRLMVNDATATPAWLVTGAP